MAAQPTFHFLLWTLERFSTWKSQHPNKVLSRKETLSSGAGIFEAARQVQLRLPPNIQLSNSMKSFSPESILSQAKPVLQDVPLLKLFKGDIGLLDTQYRPLCLLPWKNVSNKDIASFWVEVLDFTDASGEACFKELAEFALSLLAMPLGNADVERVFSRMNIVKSRLRNRMKNEMLSAILHVRYGLRLRGACCRDFQPTARMMPMLNSKNMYASGELDDMDFPDVLETSDDDSV
ncbi:hypothetical protein HPB52_007891 [Rhipicephalus sanguineus]|uniref:HAT C-terminal dimerisation domain-containing protein n=1 Tax=Rhipicephalus sanguineus TaxID=34632 RepID=A0A9D4PV01_RHISA|nr:hypothetical protein HPB52_007891 [Rhipicephalus sanguineus]